MCREPRYRDHLTRIRDTFPAPISDRKHDAYFVFSILRALDAVDDLKSEVPLLGRPRALEYGPAERAELAEEGRSVEEVARLLVDQLEGMPIWGHPRTQINVVPPPSIPSVIGSLLPAIYNPNLVSDDTSFGLMLTEAAVVAMSSRLIGYDPERAAGVFTFGGTGTVLYGAKLGIEKAFPDAMATGVPSGGVILASGQSHYCRLNVAGWLGLGEENVVAVPTHLTNDIRIDLLEKAARDLLDQGRRIVALVATMGTTDAFGIDDLDAIADLRDRLVEDYGLDYTPHIHADAVIGWAWSVFNDYNFEENPLGFRPRTVRALASARRRISKLHRADSIGFDFHKTGFAPYISSLFLVRNRDDMQLLVRGREQMPYLFQSGERHPGVYTLETSRGGSGVLAAYANLQLFGRVGLRVLLGHLVEMAETLREHLEGHDSTTVLNHDGVGTVTVFPGLSRRRRHLDDQGPGAHRPRRAGRVAAPQRLQPAAVPLPLRPGDARRRGPHLDDRLLSPNRLRRANGRPQKLHPLPVHRRAGCRAARPGHSRRAGGDPGGPLTPALSLAPQRASGVSGTRCS